MARADCHVVVFNVPWPANYGGVIDSFYRIRAMAQAGLNIALHCFDYGRGHAPELTRWCTEVFYYPRRPAAFGMLGLEPYIVSSRASVALHHRLLRDNQPILFDGLHTTSYLDDPQLEQRRKVVRMHNVEWQYYRALAGVERRLLPELYYHLESWRLRRYESRLHHAQALACISPADTEYYAELLKGEKTRVNHVAAGHPWTVVERPLEQGDRVPYALYHGNLSVGENIQAVHYLLSKVFGKTDRPLILAGMDPDSKIYDWISDMPHVTLIADPEEEEMDRLIRGAVAHVLPTFQSTGIKLKLLRALYTGGHVLVNSPMVEGTGLESFCRVADDPEEWLAALELCFSNPYQENDWRARKALESKLDTGKGAQQTIALLFPETATRNPGNQLG